MAARLFERPRDDVAARVAKLAPWFQNLDLDGVRTAPEHYLHDYPASKLARIAPALPADLTGKTVLEIGCNAGFWGIEMARRGAARVLGIDHDPRYLEQARFAAEVLGVGDVEFREGDVYEVGALGERFDLVLFMGVFYHLRHPLLALDLIREHAARDLMLFQTLLRGPDDIVPVAEDYEFDDPAAPFDDPGYPRLHFVERRYAGDGTNWFIPNRAGAEGLLRAAGFAPERTFDPDTWLCRVADAPPVGAAYPSRGAAR